MTFCFSPVCYSRSPSCCGIRFQLTSGAQPKCRQRVRVRVRVRGTGTVAVRILGKNRARITLRMAPGNEVADQEVRAAIRITTKVRVRFGGGEE